MVPAKLSSPGQVMELMIHGGWELLFLGQGKASAVIPQ